MLRKTLFTVTLAALLVSGCATGPNAHPDDPLEPMNRAVYSFNDGLDKIVAKPVAQVYKAITPEVVDTGVTNFFNNIGDIGSAINNALQFKIEQSLDSLSRFMVNTSFGLLGVLDVASDLGIERHEEDFGQTLGYWGVGTGPYVVLPVLGPSDVRDGGGLIVDWYLDPVRLIDPERDRWVVAILDLIDRRADLLSSSDILDEISLDPYETLRDGYLQRRAYLVRDGEGDDEDVDLFDEDDLLLDDPK